MRRITLVAVACCVGLLGSIAVVDIAYTEEESVAGELIDSRWTVVKLDVGRGGATAILDGSELTMTFDADAVSGSAGCNQYRADATAGDEALEIGMAAATRKFCGDVEGLMEQEMMFLAALAGVAGYRFEDDRLVLVNASGEAVMVLEAVADTPAAEGDSEGS